MRGLVRISIVSVMMMAALSPIIAAEGDFNTSIETVVDALDTKQNKISHTLTITNLQGIHYLQSASYILESHSPRNVNITSSAKILTQVEGRKVAVTFLTPLIGKDKSQSIVITYTADDLVQHVDKGVIGVIPAIEAESVASRSATIMLPAEVKAIGYASPQPIGSYQEPAFTRLMFNPDPHETVVFRSGTEQGVKLQLSFKLQNSHMTPIETQVALPPDTDYQQVLTTVLDPKPITLTTDADQNVIATYKLEPNETKKITSSHEIVLMSAPYTTQPLKRDHTAMKQNWTLPAAVLKNPGQQGMPVNIGLLMATLQPLCTSLKDTASTNACVNAIIASLRSADIPARRMMVIPVVPLSFQAALSGTQTYYVIEYFNKSSNHWVPLDIMAELTIKKTQSTAPLLNSVALVINGVNENSPLPTIMYAADTSPYELIPIQPTQPSYQISAVLSKPWLLFKPGTQAITLRNQSNTAIYNADINVVVSGMVADSLHIDRLPVNGRSIIPLHTSIKTKDIQLTTPTDTYAVNFAQSHYTLAITITASLVAAASGLAVFAGRLLVSRRK